MQLQLKTVIIQALTLSDVKSGPFGPEYWTYLPAQGMKSYHRSIVRAQRSDGIRQDLLEWQQDLMVKTANQIPVNPGKQQQIEIENVCDLCPSKLKRFLIDTGCIYIVMYYNVKCVTEFLTRICDWAARQRNPWVSSGHWAGWWRQPAAPGCSTWHWTLGCVRRSPGTGKDSGRGFSPCGEACWAAPSRDLPISPAQMRRSISLLCGGPAPRLMRTLRR